MDKCTKNAYTSTHIKTYYTCKSTLTHLLSLENAVAILLASDTHSVTAEITARSATRRSSWNDQKKWFTVIHIQIDLIHI